MDDRRRIGRGVSAMAKTTGWLAVCLLAVCAPAGAAEPARLTGSRAAYEAALDAAGQKGERKLQELEAAYESALRNLEEQLQRQGDLEGLLAVREERARLRSGDREPAAAATNAPQPLGETREKYRAARRGAEAEAAARIVDLTDRYLAVLSGMQADLTRTGKIDDAVAVKQEAERARGSATYTSAAFVAAEYAARMKAAAADAGAGTAETAPVAGGGGRPPDAVSFDGHWYKVFASGEGWAAAEARCREMGGYLACMGTRGENRFIERISDGRSLWVGGSDAESEGAWKWVSGEAFSFTDWAPGQPDGRAADADYMFFGTPAREAREPEGFLGGRRDLKPRAYAGHWYGALGQGGHAHWTVPAVAGFICEWDR